MLDIASRRDHGGAIPPAGLEDVTTSSAPAVPIYQELRARCQGAPQVSWLSGLLSHRSRETRHVLSLPTDFLVAIAVRRYHKPIIETARALKPSAQEVVLFSRASPQNAVWLFGAPKTTSTAQLSSLKVGARPAMLTLPSSPEEYAAFLESYDPIEEMLAIADERELLVRPLDDVRRRLFRELQAGPAGLRHPARITTRQRCYAALHATGSIRHDALARRCKPISSIPTTSDVLHLIETATGVTGDEVLGPSRFQRVAQARFAAMWVIRHVCGRSLASVAVRIGKRDHTTVLNGLNRIQTQASQDAGFREVIAALCDDADEIGLIRHLCALDPENPVVPAAA